MRARNCSRHSRGALTLISSPCGFSFTVDLMLFKRYTPEVGRKQTLILKYLILGKLFRRYCRRMLVVLHLSP